MEVLVHIKAEEMTDKHTHIHGSDLVSQWIFQPYSNLTLYSGDTHFNTSITDSFRKHCGKRRNCS